MLNCFFDEEGIVHREFVPLGMTVNVDFYCDVLRRLGENVRSKRPQKWKNQNLIIHHDNAPAHRSFKVSQFFAKNNMTVIPHPPYSPDLAPCDFFLFPKLKLRMEGRDSTPLKRFKRNRSGYLTQFQKGTSRDASKHGRNAETAVFVQKRSTLKVMEEFNIQGKQISFYKYCPGTFGYIPVYLCTLLVPRWILRIMRNVSNNLCTENHNTFYVQFFFIVPLWDNVEKHGTAGLTTDESVKGCMRVACRIPKAANTHS